MSSECPVALEGVTKSFRVAKGERGRRWHGLRAASAERFTAVDDVTMSIKAGEVVGLIGANGAGKSTLLKLLSRVMHPDRGRIALGGPIMSLLEVGAGFHPELTARENIFLNGAILGLEPRTVRRSFDNIVALAGVDKFLETPVKRFSSGMRVRLAIAVGLHLDCDAVVLDEVLSVGDAEFQRRCLSLLDDMVTHEGRAALLVSHNMETIRQACDRVLVLEHGRLVFDGEPQEAVRLYFAHVAGPAGVTSADLTARTNPHGDSRLLLRRLRLVDDCGQDLIPVVGGQFGFELTLDVSQAPGPFTLTLTLSTRHNRAVATVERVVEPAADLAGGAAGVMLRWLAGSTQLAAGQYSLSARATGEDGSVLDSVEDVLAFTVTDATRPAGALAANLAPGHVLLHGSWIVAPDASHTPDLGELSDR